MPAIYECLSWVALLALAQWFCGNLYEAVEFLPNFISFIEQKSGAGEALFDRKSASEPDRLLHSTRRSGAGSDAHTGDHSLASAQLCSTLHPGFVRAPIGRRNPV
jgi:hypothetical protein